jgi:hypothetical protein
VTFQLRPCRNRKNNVVANSRPGAIASPSNRADKLIMLGRHSHAFSPSRSIVAGLDKSMRAGRGVGHSRPRSTRRSSRAGSYCRARTISHGLRIGFAVRGKRLARKPTGVTFNDLRGTALTRLAIAGCTEAQIVGITGHTMRAVQSILDAHYLHRDPALAEEAIRKLEARTNSPKRAPN